MKLRGRVPDWDSKRYHAAIALWATYSRINITDITYHATENTRVGCRASTEMARTRVDEDRGEEDAWVSEG